MSKISEGKIKEKKLIKKQINTTNTVMIPSRDRCNGFSLYNQVSKDERLTKNCKKTAILIFKCIDGHYYSCKEYFAKISQKTLAKNVEVSTRTIERNISKLKKLNYIKVLRPKKNRGFNLYFALSSPLFSINLSVNLSDETTGKIEPNTLLYKDIENSTNRLYYYIHNKIYNKTTELSNKSKKYTKKTKLNTKKNVVNLSEKIIRKIKNLCLNNDFFKLQIQKGYSENTIEKILDYYEWLIKIKKTKIRNINAYLTNLLKMTSTNHWDYSVYENYIEKSKKTKENNIKALKENKKNIIEKEKNEKEYNQLQIKQDLSKKYFDSLNEIEKNKIKEKAFEYHYEQTTFDREKNINVMSHKQFTEIFWNSEKQQIDRCILFLARTDTFEDPISKSEIEINKNIEKNNKDDKVLKNTSFKDKAKSWCYKKYCNSFESLTEEKFEKLCFNRNSDYYMQKYLKNLELSEKLSEKLSKKVSKKVSNEVLEELSFQLSGEFSNNSHDDSSGELHAKLPEELLNVSSIKSSKKLAAKVFKESNFKKGSHYKYF